jgi:hypothetical protein
MLFEIILAFVLFLLILAVIVILWQMEHIQTSQKQIETTLERLVKLVEQTGHQPTRAVYATQTDSGRTLVFGSRKKNSAKSPETFELVAEESAKPGHAGRKTDQA